MYTLFSLAWHPLSFGKQILEADLQRADITAKLFIVGGGLEGEARTGALDGEWLCFSGGGCLIEGCGAGQTPSAGQEVEGKGWLPGRL